jgi:transcriptional regulator with XRE-family HTH domain
MLAMDMKEIMERENISRSELARRMKLSRARITQMMNLLKLSPEVIKIIEEMGEGFNMPVITERR